MISDDFPVSFAVYAEKPVVASVPSFSTDAAVLHIATFFNISDPHKKIMMIVRMPPPTIFCR